MTGPLAFFGYGLLILGLAAFLYMIAPVRVDRLGKVSARQELEAQRQQEGGQTGEPQPQSAGSGLAGGDASTGSKAASTQNGGTEATGGQSAAGGDASAPTDTPPAVPADNKKGIGYEPSLRRDAVELSRLWLKDLQLFNEEYGAGRSMGASGTITELRDFGGDYIITLSGEGPESPGGLVQCYFDPADMPPLKALRQGDKVSIVGECSAGVKGPILKHSRLEGRL